jgi:polyisoprenoid-binding protein YceI
VPKSETFAALFGGAHWVFGKVMAVTIALHVLGALKHQIIDRDATLRRMLNGAPELTTLPPSRHSTTPLLAAIGIWAVTLGAGSAFGLYTPHTSTTEAAQLADVTSDWSVQDGSIGIAVTQFGSVVEGSFADWTADITFDPNLVSGPLGDVEVVIAIGSLTLGSVSDQAMGPDFFDAEQFTTATYRADLVRGVDGFVAQGTLTIRDKTVPLDMPFRLSVQGESADMQADLTLDRRDFGIGDNMADESSLAFSVKVTLELTATLAAAE